MKQIKNPIHKLIINWCIDDDGRDILYKTNGEERYPDFKLYKMIARCVHNHTPQAQLDRDEFKKFENRFFDIVNISTCIKYDSVYHITRKYKGHFSINGPPYILLF